jgi:PAS domain S-box-containing protein
MKKHPYKNAKKIIHSICTAAEAGDFDTREKFLSMLTANPDVAAQGYNIFGKIFFWNPASAALYGYNEAAAVNQDLFELILPPNLQQFARDMISMASKTGKLPEPGAFDLIRRNNEFVTVFSGHLMFQWENGSSPEFYCVDIGIEPQPA